MVTVTAETLTFSGNARGAQYTDRLRQDRAPRGALAAAAFGGVDAEGKMLYRSNFFALMTGWK